MKVKYYKFNRIFKRSQNPYKEIGGLLKRFGDLTKAENYNVFREKSYPEFFSIKFVQDLGMLTEMGLIYSRSGTVNIIGTNLFPKRYERRISRFGRLYVEDYLINRYPFIENLRNRVKKVMKSGFPLIRLSV